MRLVKTGRIFAHSSFQIAIESRKVLSRINDNYRRVVGSSEMHFNEKDILFFTSIFKLDFKPGILFELAFNSYNLSYEIMDIRTKYMVLMIGLESLFNRGKDQISHVIARHLALVMNVSKEDFPKEYAANKKLYSLRSDIAHGSHTKKDISDSTDIVQEKLRYSIVYCLLNPQIRNKEDLFTLLNTKGFSDSNN